ncbi:MAG: hypothetical protein EPN26_08465 [Rhodospirillales bacterium]|nr:MAG: hypothetical protein EPN26_08465 [Rhodospirillales bacterium]
MTALLAFLETAGQAALLAEAGYLTSETVAVAVTPEADACLDAMGASHASIDDFVTLAELHRMGDANIRAVESLCETADGWLSSLARGIEGSGTVGLEAFFHPLKGLLDALALRSSSILAAIETLKPERLLLFDRPPYPFYGLDLLDKPSQGLTGTLTALIAAAGKRDVLVIPDPEPYPPPHDYTPPDKRRQVADASQAADPDSFRPLLLHALFSDLGDSVLECWKARGGRTCRLDRFLGSFASPQDHPPAQLATMRLWSFLATDPAFLKPFVMGGIDLFPVVRSFLEHLILAGMADLLAFAPAAKRGIENLPRHSVLLLGGMTGRHQVIVRAAAERGVPTVSHHFGGFLGYSLLPMHERYDMAYADFFLTGGNASRETFLHPSPQAHWNPATKRARPVATGLPFLDPHIAARRPRGRQGDVLRLLYPLSSFPGDNRYLGYVYPQDIPYWRFQKRLIRHLMAFSEVRLVVKPPLTWRYPMLSSPLLDWMEQEFPGRFERIIDVPLEECLEEVDLALIDSPSTPLLFLAASTLPFMAYIDREVFLLTETARTLLKRRCHLFESEAELFDGLADGIGFPQMRNAASDDSFLKAFLANGADLRSAERSADFLMSLATAHKSDPLAP